MNAGKLGGGRFDDGNTEGVHLLVTLKMFFGSISWLVGTTVLCWIGSYSLKR